MKRVFSKCHMSLVFNSLLFLGFFEGDTFADPSPVMKFETMQKKPSLLTSQPDIEKSKKILESNSAHSGNSLAEACGLEMFEEAFGVSSSITSFSQDVIGLPFFNTFNNVAGELGLLFSLKQFAFEIYEGKEEPAKLNLAKNLMLYSLGKWGTQALRIANTGIFFIDYSLTKFGTKGLEVREQKYQKEYDILLPWQTPNRDKQFWINFILKLVSSKDINTLLEKEMDIYLNYPFTQKDFPPDLREILVKKEKEKLLLILHAAVKDAGKEMEDKRQEEILRKFEDMKNLFNEKITILVRVFKGSKGVSGLPVRIKVNKDQNLWEGVTDNAGQWWFNCTWLGYLYYGKPNVVELEYENKIIKQILTIDQWRSGRVEFVLKGDNDKISTEVDIIEPVINVLPLGKKEKAKNVRFTARANDTGTYRYLWSFGDGKTYEDMPKAGQKSTVSNKFINITENVTFTVTVSLYSLESNEMISSKSITLKIKSDLSDDDKYNLVMASLPDYIKNFDIGWEPDYTNLKRNVRIHPDGDFVVEYTNAERASHGKYIQKFGNAFEVGGKYYMSGLGRLWDHGRYAKWNLDGQLLEEGNYKMHKRHGWSRSWFENGVLRAEGNWENGEGVGLHRSWQDHEKLASERDYTNEFLKDYHPNGSKASESGFNKHGYHGKYTKWDTQGRIVIEGNHEKGQRKGLWHYHLYDSNGTKTTRTVKHK